jgi:hypothetical protein
MLGFPYRTISLLEGKSSEIIRFPEQNQIVSWLVGIPIELAKKIVQELTTHSVGSP